MRVPFNEKWILFEKEDYANYIFVYSTWEGYTYMPEEWNFENGRFMGAEFMNGQCNLFMPLGYFDEMNRRNYRKLFSAPDEWDKLNELNQKSADLLFSFSKEIKAKNVSNLTAEETSEIIGRFFELHKLAHVPRGPMWQLETPKHILTSYLNKFLKESAEEANTKIDPTEAFRVLTTPTEENVLMKEKLALARIALINDKQERLKALDNHIKEYEWLEYGLQGRILNRKHFTDEMERLIESGAEKRIDAMENENKLMSEKQNECVNVFKIGNSHQRIFKIVRDSMLARLHSKYSQFFAYYSLEPLFLEICKIGNLSLEQLRYLTPDEFKKIILRKGRKDNYNLIADERKKSSVQISDKNQTIIWVGAEAKKNMARIIFFKEEVDFKGARELKGQVAVKGLVVGRVKIVNTVQEIVKMHSGNILVSHMTNPDIVPAMRMAAAIVTDLGGITCHAAIVARELGKPCVIGTKIATKILNDGDMVEVNANKGIVRIL